MWATAKGVLSAILPRSAIHALKKIYYPNVVRNFSDDDWPYSPVLRHLVGANDTVVDVGANIGFITCLLARWVGREGRVYSVEPVPETFDFLQHNIRKLGYRNVRLFHCAASSRAGMARMEIPRYPTGGDDIYQSHIIGNHGGEGDGLIVSVETKRLDDILHDILDAVAFIKIDVEGHELDVIRGAMRIVARSQPSLLVEVPDDPDATGSSAHILFQMLHDQGYQSYLIQRGRLCARREGDRAVDYLFLKQNHTSNLRARGLL